MPLRLEVVTESLSQRREHVFAQYEQDPGFNFQWWHSGSAKSPVSYCRVLEGDTEVARAKVLPSAGRYQDWTSWCCPVGGATEIELFEVRATLRGHGYGAEAVGLIAGHYGEPVVAMSLDESSDPFWRALGWTEHPHPSDDMARNLFTSI